MVYFIEKPPTGVRCIVLYVGYRKLLCGFMLLSTSLPIFVGKSICFYLMEVLIELDTGIPLSFAASLAQCLLLVKSEKYNKNPYGPKVFST